MKETIVIVGAGGRLGSALVRHYHRDFDLVGFTHAQLDLGNLEQVRESIGPLDFDLLINTAAQTNVDRCESHREEAFLLNAEAPRLLAEICEEKNKKLVHVSTDYVFDGEKSMPYTEEDPAEPISVYGESKREGEKKVLAVSDRHLVVRVSWVFGPERPSFVDQMLQRAQEYEEVNAVADKFSTPTYTRDIAGMLERLLWSRRAPTPEEAAAGELSSRSGLGAGRLHSEVASGIVHLANRGQCSWQEYAQWALNCCHAAGIPMKARTIGPIFISNMKSWVAKRPLSTVLSTEKYERLTGQEPRDWHDAVAEYVTEHFARVSA